MFMRRVRIATALYAIVTFVACSSLPTDESVRMKFHAIKPIPGSHTIAVILTDDTGQSFLPLYVGQDQALSIYYGQNEIASKRPLAHDLMADMLNSLKAEVERIVITDLRDNIYYAELELRKGSETVKVDARPSDAIALALRVDAPIFVMQHLLDKMSDLDYAENVLSQVRVKSWGLTVQSVRGTLQRLLGGHKGVLVTQIEGNSPAQQANLLPGDLILSVDGKKNPDLDSFSSRIAEKAAETRIGLEILRDQKIHHVMLTKPDNPNPKFQNLCPMSKDFKTKEWMAKL